MIRQVLTRIALLGMLLGSAVAARGQEPKPAPISVARLAEGEGQVQLVLEWRYHPGDDPRWADPAWDDAGWERVFPQLPTDGIPRNGWPGTGWFRRHLRVEPAMWGKPLTIRVETSGETAVFLDGRPLLAAGRAPAGPAGGAWRVMAFSPRTNHVLAVRHTSTSGRHDATDLGFRLSIERLDAPAIQLGAERRRTALLAVFIALPAFLAVLHLALFWSYPKARENLFYACAMVTFAGIVFCDLLVAQATSEAWRALAFRIVIPFVVGTIFFGLLTFYSVRTRRFPRTWIVFAAVGAALIPAAFLYPNRYAYWAWYLYFGLMVAEVIRVEVGGEKIAREGVGILLGGLIIVIAVITLQIAINLGLMPPIGSSVGGVYFFGTLAFAVSMSLFLARSFARTNVHLERRLDEVRALSGQVLAQERAAHEQEVHRHRLEAENARKSGEIEAARALQLSMLPTVLPTVEGLETAAAMTTASEVGGDYYDFRIAPDGSLVVAFGDAAGHGVAAGIMVTAIKALFAALDGGEGLAEMLANCDRVLRRMNVKPLHMCLTLARITARSVTVCSAGMPPVLIHRACTGEVEELGVGGLPVGFKLAGCWQERSAALAPGDTLLFASDGFAELLDPADNALGFAAAAEALRSAAGVPARELIERLLARVAAWRCDREQADDITFVVVRAMRRQAAAGVDS